MPASSLVRATFFALGAAVGGGAVAALNASKKREAADAGLKVPVVDVDVAGDPRFSAGAVTALGPVLKYGNPGTPATAPHLHTDTQTHTLTIEDSLLRRPHFRPTCASSVCGGV